MWYKTNIKNTLTTEITDHIFGGLILRVKRTRISNNKKYFICGETGKYPFPIEEEDFDDLLNALQKDAKLKNNQ